MKKLLAFILSLFLVGTPNLQAQLECKREIFAALGLGGISFSAALYSSYANYQKLSEKDAELKQQGFLSYFSTIYQQAHQHLRTVKGLQECSLPMVGILFSESCFVGSGLYALNQLSKGNEDKKGEDKKPGIVRRLPVAPGVVHPVPSPAPVVPNVPPVVPVLPDPNIQQPESLHLEVVPQEKTPEELAIERSLASAQEDEDLRKALEASVKVGSVVVPEKVVEEEFSPLVGEVFARINALPHGFDGQFFNPGDGVSKKGLYPEKDKEMIVSGVVVVVRQLPSLDQHEDHRATLGVVTAGDLCGYYVVANAVELQAENVALDRQKFNEFLKPAMQQIEKLRNDKKGALAGLVMLADEEIESLLKKYLPEAEMYYMPFANLIEDFNQQALGVARVYIVHTDVRSGNGHWIALKLIKNASGNVTVKVMDSMNILRTEGPGALDKLT